MTRLWSSRNLTSKAALKLVQVAAAVFAWVHVSVHGLQQVCVHGDMCCDSARKGALVDWKCWAQLLLKVWSTDQLARNAESPLFDL